MSTQTINEIAAAEDNYTAYGTDIPDSRWGMEQEMERERLAEILTGLYDRHNIDESDRIAL